MNESKAAIDLVVDALVIHNWAKWMEEMGKRQIFRILDYVSSYFVRRTS